MMSVALDSYALQEPEQTERVAANSLYALAYQLLDSGRAEEASKLFRLVMQLVPEDERGWLGTGACHEAVGQLSLAANLYAAALVATKESVRCALSFVRVMSLLGRHELAEEALERAAGWAELHEDETELELVTRARNSEGVS